MVTKDFTKNWIEQQVRFWYGRFHQTLESDWVEMGNTLAYKDIITIDDNLDTIKTKDLPKWIDDRYRDHLNKVKETTGEILLEDVVYCLELNERIMSYSKKFL